MARKIKPEDPPPSKAYLVSFGDTMTTLLAFFIVLCSLAKDQTGANMHAGTGSFISSIQGVGMPGPFSTKTSKLAVEKEAASPLYMGELPDDEEPARNATGPDDDADTNRIVNRELDVYQRYLNELEKMWELDKVPEVKGEATFDLFNRLSLKPPYLNDVYKKALQKVLPLLRRENYQVELVVWASMPSPKMWQLASDRANGLRAEFLEYAKIDREQRKRFSAVGMAWKYPNVNRPVVSINVKKINPK